jgi:hypothetical protein
MLFFINKMIQESEFYKKMKNRFLNQADFSTKNNVYISNDSQFVFLGHLFYERLS